MEILTQFMQGLWTVMGNYQLDVDSISKWWEGNYDKLSGFDQSIAMILVDLFNSFMPATTTTTEVITTVL